MKTLIFRTIYFIFSLLPIYNYAQENSTVIQKTRTSKLYLNFGLGILESSGKIGGIGLNAISSNNWGFSLSWNFYSISAEDIPPDYFGGLISFPPYDNTTSFSIRILKEFDPFTKFIRFGIEAGPSMALYKKVIFTPYNSTSFWGKNYETSTSSKSLIGLSLRAKIEFPVAGFFGIEIAIISNINKYQSYVGSELHFMLGKVRDRIKP